MRNWLPRWVNFKRSISKWMLVQWVCKGTVWVSWKGSQMNFKVIFKQPPPQVRCIDTLGLQKHLVQESKGHRQGELSQLVQYPHHLHERVLGWTRPHFKFRVNVEDVLHSFQISLGKLVSGKIMTKSVHWALKTNSKSVLLLFFISETSWTKFPQVFFHVGFTFLLST